VLTLGGRNLPVLVSEAFNWQYSNQNYGVAAAYAVVVMAVSLAATLVVNAGEKMHRRAGVKMHH
jgi:multiple sugar transport system permease protein